MVDSHSDSTNKRSKRARNIQFQVFGRVPAPKSRVVLFGMLVSFGRASQKDTASSDVSEHSRGGRGERNGVFLLV
jgi:hypothetical protein